MSEDIYTVVQRGNYLDVYFTAEVTRTRTLVRHEGASGTIRYLATRGHAKYRGMYRMRRKVGFDHSTWTTDRALAFTFASPSAARASVAKEFGKARVDSYQYEAVKMTAVERITMWAANSDFGSTRRWLGDFRIAQEQTA